MAFKLGNETRKYRTPKNTPVFRKKLDSGILGEANNDGSIYISKDIKPGSLQEKITINHEGQHAKDMKSGVLDYNDNYVRYKGKTYHRKDGQIKYNGKWSSEGSMNFPWEKKAKEAENNGITPLKQKYTKPHPFEHLIEKDKEKERKKAQRRKIGNTAKFLVSPAWRAISKKRQKRKAAEAAQTINKKYYGI